MRNILISAATVALLAAAPAFAASNVIPTSTSSITSTGGDGVLRDSTWSAGSAPSDINTITDGVFAPEGQQWNNGSFWWDEATMQGPLYVTLQLAQSFTFDHLILQGDDNDDYHVEYWNGSSWQTAFDANATGGWGLTTRDSGALTPFTTDLFRLFATGGDKYYAISEFQAFGAAVPEPASWALMILGFGAIGATLRRRRSAAVRFA